MKTNFFNINFRLVLITIEPIKFDIFAPSNIGRHKIAMEEKRPNLVTFSDYKQRIYRDYKPNVL